MVDRKNSIPLICPYCEEDTYLDMHVSSNSSDGCFFIGRVVPDGAYGNIIVQCEHCRRKFLATREITVCVNNERALDCLDDTSLCDMEWIVAKMFRCRNCGREQWEK